MQQKSFFYTLLSLLLLMYSALPAQNVSAPKSPRSHAGTDFWLTIPPNYHTSQLDGDDNLSLFITAERPTQGEIRFGDSAGAASVLRFAITNPTQPYTLVIPAKDVELRVNEQVSKRSLHILADNPVSVYALNTAHQSADGALIFPAYAAGTRFIALSYPGDNGAGIVPATPSQLGLVATSDSTRIRIVPSAPTKMYAHTPHEITLQRGETYLIQASISTSTAADLTGTVITSNKPIAVFSSHERATVPLSALSDAGARSISRDYLLEQFLPTDYWGRTVIVPPLPAPQTSASDATSSSVRILASADATRIRINGRQTTTLQAGQFYETTLATVPAASERGLVIEGSEPIAVAVYASSNGSGSGIGDPFMLFVPPQEQYLRGFQSVNVRSIQRISRTITEEAFREHYLTLLAPIRAIPSVRLDNQPLASGMFQHFATPTNTSNGAPSEYAFAHVRVSAGLHTVSADEPLGVLAIGYGNATSYGFPAGQRLELDNLAPRIATQATCGMVRGVVYDSAATDSKLFRVGAPDSLRQNVRFEGLFEGLERLISSDSLVFTAHLVNPYQDGSATILASDSLGQGSMRRLAIPGFTVHADNTLQGVQILTSTATLVTGRTACFRLSLTNYGNSPRQIDSISFSSGFLRVNAMLPILLQPNERRTVEYCLRTFQSGTFTDTLVIGDGCLKRPILAVSVEAFPDTIKPLIQETVSDCERRIEYIASDAGRFSSGVEAEIISATHCSVQIERLPNANIRILTTLPNRRNDAAYTVIVRDSAGNSHTLERTIPGLRLRYFLSGMEITNNAPLLFSGAVVSALTCATLLVKNESTVPVRLDNIRLGRNIIFSVPPAQFPFVIAGGAQKPLQICFAPEAITQRSDTLFIEQYCEQDHIALLGQAVVGKLQANSRCNVTVSLTPNANVAVSKAIPILSGDVLIFRVATSSNEGFKDGGNITVNIYDMLGGLLLQHRSPVSQSPALHSSAFQPSDSLQETEYNINIRSLRTGLYCYEVIYQHHDMSVNTAVRGMLRITQ